MPEQLSENLNLPKIGGEIVALYHFRLGASIKAKFELDGLLRQQKISFAEYKKRKEIVSDENRRENFDITWMINFTLNGPDARYKPGVIGLMPEKVTKLIAGFEIALAKMQTLTNQAFSGTYSKVVGELDEPSLEVVAENGKILLNFWVSSDKWKFSRKLDISDVEIIIVGLKKAVQRGPQMVQTLESLSQ